MCEAEPTLDVPQEQRLLCSAVTVIKSNKIVKPKVKKTKKEKAEAKGLKTKNYKLSKKEKREIKALAQSKKI